MSTKLKISSHLVKIYYIFLHLGIVKCSKKNGRNFQFFFEKFHASQSASFTNYTNLMKWNWKKNELVIQNYTKLFILYLLIFEFNKCEKTTSRISFGLKMLWQFRRFALWTLRFHCLFLANKRRKRNQLFCKDWCIYILKTINLFFK